MAHIANSFDSRGGCRSEQPFLYGATRRCLAPDPPRKPAAQESNPRGTAMQRITRSWTRRHVLAGTAGALAAAGQDRAAGPTNFQVACMTLPYSEFSFARALGGIRSSDYRYVAWGAQHRENPKAERTELIEMDASASTARQLARQCRDAGPRPGHDVLAGLRCHGGLRGFSHEADRTGRRCGDSVPADVRAHR